MIYLENLPLVCAQKTQSNLFLYVRPLSLEWDQLDVPKQPKIRQRTASERQARVEREGKKPQRGAVGPNWGIAQLFDTYNNMCTDN